MVRLRVLAITAFLMVPLVAGATMMIPLDLKALVTRADRVVLGSVLSEESHWTSSHDAIYTDSLVRIERVYKGSLKSGQTVTVRREGGSVDGIGMQVFGAARLPAGEEVVLFLEERAGAAWVVGMSQGKWKVTVEEGKKVVHADLSSIDFIQPGAPALAGTRALVDAERDIRAMKLQLDRSGK